MFKNINTFFALCCLKCHKTKIFLNIFCHSRIYSNLVNIWWSFYKTILLNKVKTKNSISTYLCPFKACHICYCLLLSDYLISPNKRQELDWIPEHTETQQQTFSRCY